MATDDQQVLVAGVASAPADFRIPGNGQIRPKTIYALYNGTAATNPFVPALKITSDGGELIGIYAACGAVAAGGSANVTWFPWLDDCACSANATAASGGTINDLVSPAGTLAVTNGKGPITSVDLPVAGVTAGSYGDAADVAQFTVDAYGRLTAASSVPIAGGGTVVASDGWVPDTTETWTYASFTAGPPAVGTFTVSGDVRAKYTMGTRIKLVQTTTKYFVVSADPTYDGTNTTVTVSGGTDYTLANAAISGNSHSYVVNPQGYPTMFSFGATVGGVSATAVAVFEFALLGRVCLIYWKLQCTSNAATFNFTAPVTAALTALVPTGLVVDNGVSQSSPGRAEIGGSSGFGVVDLGKTMNVASGGWATVGSKQSFGQMSYPV